MPYLGLRDRELRVHDNTFVAEGDIVIRRALEAGYRPCSLLIDVSNNYWREETTSLAMLSKSGAPIFGATGDLLAAITGLGVHRGSLGLFERGDPPTVDDLFKGTPVIAATEHTHSKTINRLIFCEGIMNPINLGIIARTSRALGFGGLLLSRTCTDPLYRRSSRVAMGEIYNYPWAVGGTTEECISLLAKHGFRTIGLTPKPKATPISDLELGPEPAALILGSEGPGLSETATACADDLVTIPIAEAVDSLNVASAVAIGCWELGLSRIRNACADPK